MGYLAALSLPDTDQSATLFGEYEGARGSRRLHLTQGLWWERCSDPERRRTSFRACVRPRFSRGRAWRTYCKAGFQTNVNVNVFGRNVQDKDVEEHVLNSVGSYGKQLNVVLDALMVLIKRLESHPEFAKQISQPEHHAIYELKQLAETADAVARAFQGKPPAPNGSEDTPVLDS